MMLFDITLFKRFTKTNVGGSSTGVGWGLH